MPRWVDTLLKMSLGAVASIIFLALLYGIGCACPIVVVPYIPMSDIPQRMAWGFLVLTVTSTLAGLLWIIGSSVAAGLHSMRMALIRKVHPQAVELACKLYNECGEDVLLAILSNDSVLPPLVGVHPALDTCIKQRLSRNRPQEKQPSL